MNTNKKTLGIVSRAKKTVLGRVLCRIAGEETGAVMMEYVIVAVLIAAAVATGAWFFGKDILNMFGVGGRAATAQVNEARNLQDSAQQGSKTGHQRSANVDKSFIKPSVSTDHGSDGL